MWLGKDSLLSRLCVLVIQNDIQQLNQQLIMKTWDVYTMERTTQETVIRRGQPNDIILY